MLGIMQIAKIKDKFIKLVLSLGCPTCNLDNHLYSWGDDDEGNNKDGFDGSLLFSNCP